MVICEFYKVCGSSLDKSKCRHGTPHEHDHSCESTGCFSSTLEKDSEGKTEARCFDYFIKLVEEAIEGK